MELPCPGTPKRALVPGDPLVPLSNDAIPGVGPDAEDIKHNRFTFHVDPDATACPYGAHIRRANPRNADLPEGTRGLFGRLLRILGFGRQHPHDDLIASTRFHRILRRGREYVFDAAGDKGGPSYNGVFASSASMPTSRDSSSSSRRPGSPIRNSKVSTRPIRWSAIARRS